MPLNLPFLFIISSIPAPSLNSKTSYENLIIQCNTKNIYLVENLVCFSLFDFVESKTKIHKEKSKKRKHPLLVYKNTWEC